MSFEAITPEMLAFMMFGVTMLTLLLGFPVALTLAGVALIFAYIAQQLGYPLPMLLLKSYPLRIFGVMKTETLVAIPIFIFMGVMLEKSNLAARLLETMGRSFGKMNGGLGISVILVGAMLAASTGIVGATVVTMGLMSLPVMLRAGYDARLGTGIINASGTLGQIIPPSIVLVLLADILQEANEKSADLKSATGAAVPEPVTAIDLFAGALIPGLMLVFLYIAYQIYLAMVKPELCPSLTDQDGDSEAPSTWETISVILPPVFLIIVVLGSILAGAATPTEAAAVGAVGATFLAIIYRQFSFKVLMAVGHDTVSITSMVFIIIVGAQLLSLVFTGLGGTKVVEHFLETLPGGAFAAMLLVMAVIFILGFFLDYIEIILIVIPIVGPILIALGYDPLWLGVMIGINLQTSFLTPPFGFALFYLRGVAPPSVSTMQIYKGVVPFIGIQLFAIAIIWTFPEIVTWLPSVLTK